MAKALELSEGKVSKKRLSVLEEIFSEEHDHLKEFKILIKKYENN